MGVSKHVTRVRFYLQTFDDELDDFVTEEVEQWQFDLMNAPNPLYKSFPGEIHLMKYETI